ncbi:hypothetical protein ACGFZK_26060 [Streptomyces sp. NPDC048257]|uniref:hypothetical protein n=1 Tax=Streptomyces sp. NPDC048257 TaxID=3365526 RepID=UPI0037246545
MTHRSRTQRLVLLSASTALVTTGLLPSTGAFATPAPAHVAVTAATVTPTATPTPIPTPAPTATKATEDWVRATDAPTGITAELPGKAELRKGSVPIEGKDVAARAYGVDVPDAGIGFSVHDMPGDQFPLQDSLEGFLAAYNLANGDTLTSSDVRKTTVDGRPALDARLADKDDADRTVGSIRLISDDDHLVMAITLGSEAQEKELKRMHERLLSSLRIP